MVRLDGSKLCSGHFKTGKQVGEWTTYDATGKVVKVRNLPIELGSKRASTTVSHDDLPATDEKILIPRQSPSNAGAAI